MDAARSTRVWTLWFRARPGARPVHRGEKTSLTEAWALWDWAAGKVRKGLYRGEDRGEISLVSPEGEVLATADVATREVQVYPSGRGQVACERAGIHD